jgi:hypothetical protein
MRILSSGALLRNGLKGWTRANSLGHECRVYKWEQLTPERPKYEIVFSATDVVASDWLAAVQRFVEAHER